MIAPDNRYWICYRNEKMSEYRGPFTGKNAAVQSPMPEWATGYSLYKDESILTLIEAVDILKSVDVKTW
jgi:hypothetical protein